MHCHSGEVHFVRCLFNGQPWPPLASEVVDCNFDDCTVKVDGTAVGPVLIIGIEDGELLAQWPVGGAQPYCVVTDDTNNCFISCAALPMMKWADGQAVGEQMDSTKNGKGVTQCLALDPDVSSNRLIGAAYDNVSIFNKDTCQLLTRFSLPGEQYHIQSARGNGAGTYGGVFQRKFYAEDAGTRPRGVFLALLFSLSGWKESTRL